MAAPAGATHRVTLTAPQQTVQLPDAGSTFGPLPLKLGSSHATFINGLAAGAADLRIFDPTGAYEVPWGLHRLTQGASPELIVSLGIPSTYPLLATGATEFVAYRGCDGNNENKAGVVPASIFGMYAPANDANTRLSDWTSNANHANGNGTPTYGEAGPVAGAVTLSGDDWFGTGEKASLAFTTGFTIAMWSKRSASNGDSFYLLDGQNHKYVIWLDQGGGISTYVRNADDNGWASSPGGSVSVGAWQHFAFTYNGAQMRMYVNGVGGTPVAATHTIPNVTGGLYLGTYQGGSYNWKGSFAEIQAMVTGRSAAWIAAYYAACTTAGWWTVGAEEAVRGIPSPRRFNAGLWSPGTNPGVM